MFDEERMFQVFHEVAYKAHNRDHLIAGLDEFLDLVSLKMPLPLHEKGSRII